jgi:type II secretory pathway pseudopilin PulG
MRKGFTLVELLVVLGMMIVLGAVVFANLSGKKNNADLTSTTQEVATLLRQAQSNAAFQENNTQANDVAWGVHFANTTGTITPFYALFTGSYAASTTVGYYVLPSTVAYQTSTLAGGATLDVIFSPVIGASSVSTSIGFYMPKENTALSSTISIASSGAVNY